jgi:hypothetical protein
MGALAARGRWTDNQEIADARYISLRIVRTHVATILAKLGLISRTAVVTFAVRHGLVRRGVEAGMTPFSSPSFLPAFSPSDPRHT